MANPPDFPTTLHNILTCIVTFVGDVPDSLFELSQLSTIDLSGNQLNGVYDCSNWPNNLNSALLKVITCRDKSLSGQIPQVIGFSTNLKIIILQGNSISGKISMALYPIQKSHRTTRHILTVLQF